MGQQLVLVGQGVRDGGIGLGREDPQQQLAQQPQGEVEGLVQGAGVGDDGPEELRQDGAQAGQGQGVALRGPDTSFRCCVVCQSFSKTVKVLTYWFGWGQHGGQQTQDPLSGAL